MEITSEIDQPEERWKDGNFSVEFVTLSDSVYDNNYRVDVSFFKSGIHLRIDIRRGYRQSWMNFKLFVPRKYENRTLGFLGYLDKDPLNEFRTRNNTLISISIDPNCLTGRACSYNHDAIIFPHLDRHCE